MEPPVNNKKCTDCGKVFTLVTDLQRHKNRKTPCVIRELTFEQLNNPNKCEFCNRTFVQPQTLTRHLKICKIKIARECHARIDVVDVRATNVQDQLKQVNVRLDTLEKKVDGEEVGHLYFIVEMPFRNFVKIGMSKDPVGRLKQLQTGNPSRLVIYHTFESTDYKLLERTMHNICQDLRAVGEWFEMNQSQLDSIIGSEFTSG
jgi:hypothetical protein